MLRGSLLLVAITVLAGCTSPRSEAARDQVYLSAAPDPVSNFSWVVDGELAGMADPNSFSLEGHLAFLEEEGVEILVSLTEEGTDPARAAAHDITVVHLPVRDFSAPTLDQLFLFAWLADQAIAEGRPVGVHCGAGLGRTGTFLASYFVAQGMTAQEAIDHVRSLRPGSIETADQILIIHDFADALSTSGEGLE